MSFSKEMYHGFKTCSIINQAGGKMKPKPKNCIVCKKKFQPKVANSVVCGDECRKVRATDYEKNRKRDTSKKSEYMKNYYQEHKSDIKSWRGDYYKKNKEEILEHNKKYRDEHRDEIRVRAQQLYRENIDDRLATRKKYREKNRDRINKWQRENYKEKVK